MPELPEVETIVRGLKSKITNSTITKVDVRFPKCLANTTPEKFIQKLVNTKILSVNRRGKQIIFKLSNPYSLLLHLRMTGKVLLRNPFVSPNKHDHVILHLDNNISLFYNDTRKFGRFTLTKNPQSILNKLGPEPLGEDFIFSEFSQKLAKTQRKIKALLLDQHIVAGLGNIYTDEALWEAGLHPEQPAHLISIKKQKLLFHGIQNVLRKGIKNNGTSLGDGQTNYTSSNSNPGTNQHSLNVFARTGQPCPHCQRPIKKIVVAQRGTHYCSNCQRLRKN